MLDQIVTDENAFAVAEALARDPESTAEQISAACGVLAQSADPFQRILARELRAGMFALPGAELQTDLARDAQGHSESIERFLDLYPEMRRADRPAYPAAISGFLQLKRDVGFVMRVMLERDAAFVAGMIFGIWAVYHWWPL